MFVSTLVKKYFTPFDREEHYILNKEKYKDFSKEEVFEMWFEYGKWCSVLGTYFHSSVKNLLENKEIETKTLTFDKEIEYYKTQKNIKIPDFFSSEIKNLKIFLEEEIYNKGFVIKNIETKFIRNEITGIIDSVFYNEKEDCYLIVDWKWNKKIEKESLKKALKPYDKLPDNKYGQYCLQLLFYQFLLNRKNIKKMIIRLYKEEIEIINVD